MELHMAYNSHMWPRYPAVASITPRSRTTSERALGLNGADGVWKGPSRIANKNSAAEIVAAIDAATMIALHCPSARTRRNMFGAADPTVNAPTKTPIAVPRRDCHQPATILIPGG